MKGQVLTKYCNAFNIKKDPINVQPPKQDLYSFEDNRLK